MAVTAKGAEAMFKRLGVGSPTIKTAAELRLKTFPPLKFIVPGLIVEGLVILAGKPKVRKSWMALDIALAVAAGRFCLGDRKCQQGNVLYLALEDGDRRLQRRITKLLPTFGDECRNRSITQPSGREPIRAVSRRSKSGAMTTRMLGSS